MENMSAETADKAINFFIRQIKASGLDVEENKPVLIFYGGEPMVNFEILSMLLRESTSFVRKNSVFEILKCRW